MICRRDGCANPVWSWFYQPPWCSPECRQADQLCVVPTRPPKSLAFELDDGFDFAADLAAPEGPVPQAVEPRPPSTRGWLGRLVDRVNSSP